VVVADVRGQPEIRAEEGGAKFGDEFFEGVALGAKAVAVLEVAVRRGPASSATAWCPSALQDLAVADTRRIGRAAVQRTATRRRRGVICL
jgi:hypothetical protein